MKLTAIIVHSVASLPAILLAHAYNPLPQRRQASAASSSASPASTGTLSAGSSTFSTPIYPTPTYSPPAPTLAYPPTVAPGSTPSNIPNAPGIPDSTHLTLFPQGEKKKG
jgi:hypothetical protein